MSEEKPRARDYFRAIFLHVPDQVDWISWGGRALLLVVLLLWSFAFWGHSVESNYVGASFLHRVNLVFHEAEHIVFIPFGRFLTVLGGSLMQVLMPLIVMGTFLLKTRDTVGGAVGRAEPDGSGAVHQ